jgi:hypothetical protein
MVERGSDCVELLSYELRASSYELLSLLLAWRILLFGFAGIAIAAKRRKNGAIWCGK